MGISKLLHHLGNVTQVSYPKGMRMGMDLLLQGWRQVRPTPTQLPSLVEP